jgi:acetyltransferase
LLKSYPTIRVTTVSCNPSGNYPPRCLSTSLIQTLADQDGAQEEIGVARYVKYPDGPHCEFALAVADAWHGKGVGTVLMQALMANARSVGLESMEGFLLSTNQPMLKLARFLGFSLEISKDDPTQMTARKDLLAPA